MNIMDIERLNALKAREIDLTKQYEKVKHLNTDCSNWLWIYIEDLRKQMRSLSFTCHCEEFSCMSKPIKSTAMKSCPIVSNDWPVRIWLKKTLCNLLD